MVSLDEKAAQKKEAILSATLDLIFEKGFHGTPMSLVAQRADVGAGTIYRYFKNKEDLISELLWSVKRDMVASLLKGHDKKASIQDRYRRIIRNLIDYLKSDPKKFRFIDQFTFSPFINAKAQAEISLFMKQSLMDLYDSGIKEKAIKPMPFELLFALVYGTVSFLVNLHLGGYYNLNDGKNIKAVIDSCWDAVKR